MRWISRLFGKTRSLKGLAASADGSAAAEFSMFLPIFVMGALAMGDAGLALHERMTLDHVVRAGAQTAMADPGEDQVLSTLRTTASNNFTLASETDNTDVSIVNDPLDLNVTRYCACPDNRSVGVSCSAMCSETVPPFVFYRMTAAKDFNGVLLPTFAVGREMEVQTR
jgi:pilus assembly protein CpaE